MAGEKQRAEAACKKEDGNRRVMNKMRQMETMDNVTSFEVMTIVKAFSMVHVDPFDLAAGHHYDGQ